MKSTSMKTNRRPQRGPITHANAQKGEKNNTASRLSRFGLEVACSTFACLCLAEAARIKCEQTCLSRSTSIANTSFSFVSWHFFPVLAAHATYILCQCCLFAWTALSDLQLCVVQICDCQVVQGWVRALVLAASWGVSMRLLGSVQGPLKEVA